MDTRILLVSSLSERVDAIGHAPPSSDSSAMQLMIGSRRLSIEAAVSATVATRIAVLRRPVALGFLVLPLALSSGRKLAAAS
jgi:hypothetical protein